MARTLQHRPGILGAGALSARPVRLLLRALGILIVTVVALSVVLAVVSQTAPFKEWVRGVVVRQAARYLNGTLHINRLRGSLFTSVELEGVTLQHEGKTAVAAEQITVRYHPLTLIREGIVLDNLALVRPVIYLERGASGWNFSRFLKTRERSGTRPSIGLQNVEITAGRVEIHDKDQPTTVLSDLDAQFGFSSSPYQIVLGIKKLSSDLTPSGITLRQVSGSTSFRDGGIDVRDLRILTERSDVTARFVLRDSRDEVDATVIGHPLSLPELSHFVPGLSDVTLEPHLSVDAKGPLDNLQLDVTLDSMAGHVMGPLIGDFQGPQRSLRGSLALDRVNLAPILRAVGDTRITGQTSFEVRLPEDARSQTAVSFRFAGPDVRAFGYDVAPLRAQGVYRDRGFNVEGSGQAYGASVNARATVQLPRVSNGPYSYTTSGRFLNLDLTRLPSMLPSPRLNSRLAGSFDVSGQRSQWVGDVRLSESQAEDATIVDGTTAHIASRGGRLEYAAAGGVRNLDVQRLGEPLELPLLLDERFRGRLNADFTMTGEGRTLEGLRLKVDADLHESEAAGGHLPEFHVAVDLADRRLTTLARGSFRGINPTSLGLQRVEPSELTGTADVTVVVVEVGAPSVLERLQATGSVMLDKSTLAGVAIETAEVKGAYVNRVGRIEHLTITGTDLNATASGVLALDDETESNLEYDVTASDLTLLAKFINRPVQGAARVQGTVMGRTAELTTEGNLTASQLQYGNRADILTLASQYRVSVPQLDFNQASGRATSRAALAKLGGFELTEITADTTYQAPELEFRTSFAERTRAVDLAGTALLHPDHQEVHLRTLSLGVGETVWQLTDGQEALVRYGNQAVTITGLELQRAEQRLAMNGTFLFGNGEEVTTSGLHDVEVRAERLQIRDLNELMLGDRQIAGVLDGSAHLAGPAAAPEVDGSFSLTNGEVDGVMFESFRGDVDYRDRNLEIDVQLIQTPGATLTAVGTVPLSLVRASAARGDEPVDLRVESGTIELGLFQSLTTQVTDLRGQLQVALRATGTARAPRVDGDATVTNGTFRVAGSGVVYSELGTRLRFQGDRLLVDQLSVVDDDGDLLRAEGALGIQERRITTLDVLASGSQFNILDNDLGHVELDLLLRLSGEVQRPVIEGNVETRAGRLEVGRLLEELTANPYRVESEASAEETPGLFDSTTLALKIHVSDNMLLRGNNIRARSSRIGLGGVNMTIGGDLDLDKRPGAATQLVGSVSVVRGFYDFQGRRFEVERDSLIRFEGIEPLNPTLQIAATREISGVVTRINLRGTVRAPELMLSSQPPLDEADILSLIVFNQPVNTLGQNERVNLVERAGALAAGYVTAPLGESIADALDLDFFEIRTVGESGLG
ncbi:MAG: hypothetical protein EHM89_02605, partial [Acidobacteria bacterium]